MTRIRYVIQDTKLVSKPMLAGTMVITAEIDSVANKYSIVDSSGKTLAAGSAVDLAVAKKMVKTLAQSLGVVFQDEVRRRNAQTSV